MRLFRCFVLVILLESLTLIPRSHQLQSSQIAVLQQIRKHLEFPLQLDSWDNYNQDLCNLPFSPHTTVTCEENSVFVLKIAGDKSSSDEARRDSFQGFPIRNRTLSERFSIESFVTTLTRLPGLKVLSLVSLGIWGPLPDKIHRLSSLEFLDLSSNFMFGSVPAKISTMARLNALVLDNNYFNGTGDLDWIGSLSNLTVLSARENRLQGRFPGSVSRIKTLAQISMSGNEFSGELPDLSRLTGLRVLDLRENYFDSELPVMPKGLLTALLSKNLFSGHIPEHFRSLTQLQHLDLSFNSLTGTPPPSLFSLPNMSYLNLASNELTGSLPGDLVCGEKLGSVDISRNKLSGDLPRCLAGDDSDGRVVDFERNCLSVNSGNQHHGSFCRVEASDEERSRRKTVAAVLIVVIIGSLLFLVISAIGVFFFCRRSRSRKASLPKNQDNSASIAGSDLVATARYISQASKLGKQGSPACRVFSYKEVREATENFHASKFMGEGSIGKLHSGKLENGTCVAVRSMVFTKKYSVQSLRAQLDFLSKLHHPNLVGLLGHCTESCDGPSTANKVYLVYEFVPNGSYRSYLSETGPEKVLKWSDRLAILIGIAKAVHFLHTGVIPGCFNNRLKTNNILLDEHRIGKLSDYGISVIKEETEKLEAKAEGQKSSHKKNLEDDVYNFGFILLESLVGPIVRGKAETFLLNEMTSFGSQDGRKKIVDPIVLTTCSQESLSIMVSITRKCISPDPASRPSFEDVLWNLQYAAQVQATADADQKSDS